MSVDLENTEFVCSMCRINAKVIECDGTNDKIQCRYCGKIQTARCNFEENYA